MKKLLALAFLVSGCGIGETPLEVARHLLLQGSGTSGKFRDEPSRPAPLTLEATANTTLRGAIHDENGGGARTLQGWIVAAIERDTRIARVGEIDAAGLFTLPRVSTHRPQTLALLTPDYQLSAVLSIPNRTPSTIRQFFTTSARELPILINRGAIITFHNLDGLRVTRDLASDQNGDGVPDGSVSIGERPLESMAFLDGRRDSSVDFDMDGVPNERDTDIDGDGIMNVLDPDDNGNGVLDIFDPDANGDYVADATPGEADTDPFFVEGTEWISTQFAMRPRDDGDGFETSLTFITKVRDDVTPVAVAVRGAPSLLNGSYFISTSASGDPLMTAFNRLLADDGQSHDGRAGDGIFGRKVILQDGKEPRAHETLFFQLAFGPRESPWHLEFPFVFPDLRLDAISAQYDASTRTALLVGNPFGEFQTFQWHAIVSNAADGKVVWTSVDSSGQNRTMAIPEHIFTAGVDYKLELVAVVPDKIQGMPSYSVYSRKYDIE